MKSVSRIEDKTRRTFLGTVTGLVAAGGLGAAAWTIIRSSGVSEDILARSKGLEIELSKIPLGGEYRVLVDDRPYFIRYRTPAEIRAARNVDLTTLEDPEADIDRLHPKPDGSFNEAIFIVSGKCTFMSCPLAGPSQGETGEFGGWYCQCCGSHYDTSGRIRKGPARGNLSVPEYKYLSETRLKIFHKYILLS